MIRYNLESWLSDIFILPIQYPVKGEIIEKLGGKLFQLSWDKSLVTLFLSHEDSQEGDEKLFWNTLYKYNRRGAANDPLY